MIMEDLFDKYFIDKSLVQKIIEESSFCEMLREEPKFVMHFNVEYWGDIVKSEYDQISKYKQSLCYIQN